MEWCGVIWSGVLWSACDGMERKNERINKMNQHQTMVFTGTNYLSNIVLYNK